MIVEARILDNQNLLMNICKLIFKSLENSIHFFRKSKFLEKKKAGNGKWNNKRSMTLDQKSIYQNNV